MIHVMNFKGEIIDYISRDDNALVKAVHHRNINDRTETFDFTILSERTINMQERNRIIIQDKNGQYREFIIDHISQDIDGYTEIETVASYLEDIAKAKPYAPHKFEKMTTRQALSDVLKDTGWSVSDQTEYGGVHTTSWTSYQTRYEVLLQLCTSYKMMVDFYIEIGSNSVEKRYVMLRKRQPLFNGKEITYGKDLTGLKRTVDYSEVKTALLCVGPEKEGGKRIELIVKDDDAQARIGLPGRYNWGIYEPETEDENMDEKRLRTLGTTELNKRKKEAISYEVTALDIQKAYSHEVVNLGDMVRIKNRDFTPALYVEAEVISEEYDMIAQDVVYGFGEYVEYREKDLRDEFTKKLDDIRSKLNDSISNINTIVKDSVDGQLEYFERKIIKSATPPENPVNDTLWLDISNPDVPVLKRYWNGQWILASVDDVEKIGGITREKALFSELKNTFINLSIQHSKLLKEMYEILSSEYLVDEDLKSEVNTKLDATIEIYNNIKSNLESMTEDTATIGKLIDTQALFLTYRQKLQDLYNSVEKAKLAIEKRFKLLQSQYTDEKFNDAMTEIANVLPNGHWDPDTKQLTSDIPNKDDLEQMRLKLIESLVPINDRIESIQKEVKNYENGMELTIDKKIKEYNNGSGNIYRYSNPLVFKEADYYKATSITNEPEKSIRYNYKTEINFGALDYYKWEVGKPYTFSFTIKVDTPFVVVNTLNDGNKLHPAKLEIPSNEWQRKSITFIPESEDSSKGITLNLSIDTGDSGIEWAGIVGTGSSIGAISVKDFQLEKGDEASPQKPNVNDLDESYKYITNKVIQSTAKISAFEDRINLKADKSEVAQTLDEKLQPIKNDVLQQNANIELLPNKITQQVTQQIYETTISGLVKRLEAEESKRETLANQINDTVSIRQYQAGIQEAKEYADEQLKDVANAPGIREGIAQANEEAQESLRQYINAQDALKQQESQAYVDGQISVEEQRAINEAKQKLSEAKRHAEDKANEAQRLSNSYTDGQIRNANRERDQILTQYDSRISQNGREIALRTTKNEFNATNRTLSRVMSEIVQNVTTGATIRFDDNGTAQSLNVGPSGVLINSSKFQINDGDVVVQNGRTTIKDAYIDKLFSKQATINYLKAVDVDLNRATVSGTSNGESTVLSGGKIRSTGSFTRTFPQGNVTYEAYTESWNGVYRSGLISKQFGGRKLTNITRWLSLTDKTVTTQREIHSLSPDKNGARFIDFFADENYNSDVYGQGMHIYSGQQLTIESEYGLYLNANKRFYIRTVDSGLEINKDGQNLILKRTTPYTSTVGSGGSYMAIQSSDGVEQAHVGILSNNRSLSLSSSFGEVLLKGNKVFALDTNGNNRVPMYAQYFSGEKVIGNIEAADTNIYAMCHSELRVVSKAGYNGGNPEYKNIRFNSWNAMSHEKYKYDIQKWDYNVLELFRNDLQLYAYKVNSEAGTDYTRIHHGIVLRENSNLDKFPVEWRNSDGFDGNEVLWWNIKATQELANENEELKKQIDELKEKIDVILEMVK
ncbi:phage tail spike protein [Staphylococcus coagulans]|uniref:phage tail spike protein n=1 Tax=Staphylococcus coagulans TaxID=74706 RepID=UPI003D112D6F